MKKVIIYSRIAILEDTEGLNPLNRQEEELIVHCQTYNYQIIGAYREIFSGNTFDRPEWSKLKSYIKNNPGEIDMVLSTNLNRIIRNPFLLMNEIEVFKGFGVEIQTTLEIGQLNFSEILKYCPIIEEE
jgi:DNA invertase Pin-like site-specific DNA recombinase